MDSILPAESIVDKNNLNELSIDLCNYFHLNNKEIDHLRKCFETLLAEQCDTKYSHIRYSENEVHMHLVTLNMILLPIPFHEEIVSCFKKSLLDWNAFFQLIVFFSLSPSITIYYYLIVVIARADPQCISWNNILKLTVSLKTQQFATVVYHETFTKHDINNDGYLSFHQFLLFVSESRILFEPLEVFRTRLIETYLSINICNNIIFRLSHLSEIEEYTNNHKGKFPSDPCTYSIKSIVFNLTPKYRYDYCISMNKMTYSKILKSFIGLYEIDYHSSVHRGVVKILRNLSRGNYLLNNIDGVYFKLKQDTAKSTHVDSSLLLSSTTSDDALIKRFLKQNSSLQPQRSDTSFLKVQISQTSSILKRNKTTFSSSFCHNNNLEIRGAILDEEKNSDGKNCISVTTSDVEKKLSKTDYFE